MKATNWRVFQGEHNGGILEYQRMQVMDISLLNSDGTWVVYLSHTYLGVSKRFSAEAQVIPGVRRLVWLFCLVSCACRPCPVDSLISIGRLTGLQSALPHNLFPFRLTFRLTKSPPIRRGNVLHLTFPQCYSRI